MSAKDKDNRMMRIDTPLDEKIVQGLHIMDRVLLSGVVYTARDAAHKRLVELMDNNEPLPFDLEGQIIYYVGPTPAMPGRVIGAAGPTSSYRMDVYTPRLLAKGLRGMIGKGARGLSVREAIREYQAVYFAAIGGAGALMSRCIISAEVIAYPDLGPEAISKLVVKDMPLIVANDIYGGDSYEQGVKNYAR